LRNNASVAHPNEALLDEPEAMLAINAARTILHYLDAKLTKHRKDQATRKQEAQKVTIPFDDDIPF
jgi:Abortive infection C-terminus